jgi:hypothetical protein
MTKIELIEEAIERADNFQSKVKDLAAYDVPALASLKIRCLLNNLGELATNYMECGVHRGGTFCSTVAGNKNIKKAFAIDSWESDHMGGEIHETQFLAAAKANVTPSTKLVVVKDDCFSVDLSKIDSPIDMFLYDAGHSRDDQRKALTYYYPVLANEFIYCCDDWQFGEVKEGTLEGIKEMGFDVLFEKELLNTTQGEEHLNMEWWRGYYVALLRKKTNTI